MDLDEVLAATFSLISPHLTERRRDTDPGLLQALDGLIDPDTRGNPESPLRWTCKSTRELDRGRYPLGVKVCDEELAAVPLVRHEFHGEWNDTLHPAAAQPLPTAR